MRLATTGDAEVVLAHIVSVPELTRIGSLDAEGADLEQRVIAYNHRIASAYLDRLRARADGTGARVRTLVVRSESARTRLERVVREEGTDLVVMSAQGHSGRADCACGSVTEHAVTHVSVPLLVVRDRARAPQWRAELPGSPRRAAS
jgi:nucleotide-binding universal stress UspA family protein